MELISVPDIDWVTVPAGNFIYGEKESQTTLYLDEFDIARYPVTNRQYQCFIDDDGYEVGHWWQGLEKPQPQESDWPQGNRPKVNVDWNEATAFTRWLSARLDTTTRLPFEHEWHKTARGDSERIYPWGDDYQSGYANIDETGSEGGTYLEQTTAVGFFPLDKSPYGARDMAGNVVEWCNQFNSVTDEVKSTDALMPVLRGGSWYGLPSSARVARRLSRFDSADRLNYVGFRLLRSPPS